jgi:Lon protease-like protein
MDTIQDVARRFQLPENTTTKIQEASIPQLLLALEKPSKTFRGGRLLATYEFAESGGLAFQHDCSYGSESQSGDDCRKLDEELLTAIKEKTSKELDCHVCYNLMFDPVTTPCGHTFCRKCLARVLDHAIQCPLCRRTLPIPPSLERQASNVRLVSLLLGLYPDLVKLREEAVAADERGVAGQLDTPIFVCTLAFPSLPTYLHIFEPRYRLMIRRAIEGNRRFGMVMYNHNPREGQSDLGAVPFMEYGTMLEIITVRMLADGRSLIETRGCDRFRIKAHGILDGYLVGRVEPVEDVSLAEEERLEAEEINLAMSVDSSAEEVPTATEVAEVQQFSTQKLHLKGIEFINNMQANSAPWLHQRIIDAYGGPPDDPALFPYWFATVLPIADEEKYQLLKTTTVRERLKIVFAWIKRIERQRW